MLRAAFHTGWLPPNVLRLTKSQLDGACTDKRYPDDFFLDLIFEKPDADAIAKHIEKEADNETIGAGDANRDGRKGKGPVVKAASFDSMLQGDSRFWDVIKTKKQELVKKSDNDPFWGPTVGRRRGDSQKKAMRKHESNECPPSEERIQLETFSIGNEFDFLPVVSKAEDIQTNSGRDTLMDALNALEEEEAPNHGDTEEIVFDSRSSLPSSRSVQGSESPASIVKSAEESATSLDHDIANAQDEAEDSIGGFESELARSNQQGDNILQEDDDMDALLASADEDFGDLDLADFDDDDDLEDLENMLKT